MWSQVLTMKHMLCQLMRVIQVLVGCVNWEMKIAHFLLSKSITTSEVLSVRLRLTAAAAVTPDLHNFTCERLVLCLAARGFRTRFGSEPGPIWWCCRARYDRKRAERKTSTNVSGDDLESPGSVFRCFTNSECKAPHTFHLCQVPSR